MKKTNLFKKVLAIIVCIVLIAAMGLMLTSCKETDGDNGPVSFPATSSNESKNDTSSVTSNYKDGYGNAPTNIGQGDVSFIFRVTDKDGYDILFRVFTNEKTVGDALQKVGLIEGTVGDYGLYVTTVNGIKAIYEADKSYWAFYVDNKYATTGVDKTEVTPDMEYGFKVQK